MTSYETKVANLFACCVVRVGLVAVFVDDASYCNPWFQPRSSKTEQGLSHQPTLRAPQKHLSRKVPSPSIIGPQFFQTLFYHPGTFIVLFKNSCQVVKHIITICCGPIVCRATDTRCKTLHSFYVVNVCAFFRFEFVVSAEVTQHYTT